MNLRSNGIILTFDKDHDLCMNFVSAAANLRAETYGLPLTSLWRCKSIAGAIQPAITATNAIVAGLEVEQAMKLLKLILRNVIPTKQEFDDAGLRFVSYCQKNMYVCFVRFGYVDYAPGNFSCSRKSWIPLRRNVSFVNKDASA